MVRRPIEKYLLEVSVGSHDWSGILSYCRCQRDAVDSVVSGASSILVIEVGTFDVDSVSDMTDLRVWFT